MEDHWRKKKKKVVRENNFTSLKGWGLSCGRLGLPDNDGCPMDRLDEGDSWQMRLWQSSLSCLDKEQQNVSRNQTDSINQGRRRELEETWTSRSCWPRHTIHCAAVRKSMQVPSVIVLPRFVVDTFGQTQRIPLEELPSCYTRLDFWECEGEMKGLTHSEGEILVLWQGSSVAAVPESQGRYWCDHIVMGVWEGDGPEHWGQTPW